MFRKLFFFMGRILRMNKVIKDYENACLALAFKVNHQLFDDERDFSWVGDEIGDVCDFGDIDYLDPNEMVLIVRNKVTYKQYAEWRDANIENEKYINLKSWLMGARHYMFDEKES